MKISKYSPRHMQNRPVKRIFCYSQYPCPYCHGQLRKIDNKITCIDCRSTYTQKDLCKEYPGKTGDAQW